jgi:hypothetical protein
MNDCYAEEIRARLGRPAGRRAAHDRDRDIARLLSPWRRHGAGPDPVVRRG